MPINWLINGLYAWWLIVRAFSSLPFASCPRDIPCGWPPWDLLGVEMQGYHSLDGVVSASGFIAACILLSWSSWQCQPLQRWWTSRKPSHLPGIALEFLGLNCFGHLIALPRLVQVLAFRMNLFEKKKKKTRFLIFAYWVTAPASLTSSMPAVTVLHTRGSRSGPPGVPGDDGDCLISNRPLDTSAIFGLSLF